MHKVHISKIFAYFVYIKQILIFIIYRKKKEKTNGY